MVQLSLKILLAVLMFVNLAFTVSSEDLASKESKNVVILAHTENTIHTNEHLLKTDKVDNKNESFKNADKNVTNIDHRKTPLNEEASTKTLPATLQNSNLTQVSEKKENHNQKTTERPIEETTPINQVIKIKNTSGFTGEQKDLIEVSVSPQDEENVPTIVPILSTTNSSVSIVTEATSSSTTLKSINETTTVDDVTIQKEKSNNESSDNDKVKYTTYQRNTTESINVTIIEDNKTTKTIESSSSTTSKSIEITTVLSNENDQVEVGISTVAVENEKKVVKEYEDVKSKPLFTNEKDSNGSMSPGIILMITGFAVAVAIIVGYISIIIWKQYLQHRYGRRELLVNELEFDTNDLRHFEL